MREEVQPVFFLPALESFLVEPTNTAVRSLDVTFLICVRPILFDTGTVVITFSSFKWLSSRNLDIMKIRTEFQISYSDEHECPKSFLFVSDRYMSGQDQQ